MVWQDRRQADRSLLSESDDVGLDRRHVHRVRRRIWGNLLQQEAADMASEYCWRKDRRRNRGHRAVVRLVELARAENHKPPVGIQASGWLPADDQRSRAHRIS